MIEVKSKFIEILSLGQIDNGTQEETKMKTPIKVQLNYLTNKHA